MSKRRESNPEVASVVGTVSRIGELDANEE